MKRHRRELELPVLERLVRPSVPDLSIAAARALIELEFAPEDRQRMHDLSLKNNAGTLDEEESLELDRYLRLGSFLDLIHAKARRALQRKPASKGR